MYLIFILSSRPNAARVMFEQKVLRGNKKLKITYKDNEKGSTMCRNSQFSPNILHAVLYVSNVISIIKSGRDEGLINCTLRQRDARIKSRPMSCTEPRSMHVRHEKCIKSFDLKNLREQTGGRYENGY
jgi:hypothetical protein